MPTTSDRPADQLRDRLAALLAHHADVLASRWDAYAPDPAAYSLRLHAAELTADEETPFIRELLDAAMTFEAERPALAVARQLLGTTSEDDRRCVCGDPVEWMTHPDGPGWIHSPGSDTRCLDARPVAVPPAPADRAAVLRAEADRLDAADEATRPRLAAGITWATSELRRLAGEAAAGAHQTEQAHRPGRCPVMIPGGGRCEKNADHQAGQPDDPHTPTPAVPAAPEEPTR
ncbi:hypothetical protein ACIA9I_12240 [Streptomyces anulatus]